MLKNTEKRRVIIRKGKLSRMKKEQLGIGLNIKRLNTFRLKVVSSRTTKP